LEDPGVIRRIIRVLIWIYTYNVDQQNAPTSLLLPLHIHTLRYQGVPHI